MVKTPASLDNPTWADRAGEEDRLVLVAGRQKMGRPSQNDYRERKQFACAPDGGMPGSLRKIQCSKDMRQRGFRAYGAQPVSLDGNKRDNVPRQSNGGPRNFNARS